MVNLALNIVFLGCRYYTWTKYPKDVGIIPGQGIPWKMYPLERYPRSGRSSISRYCVQGMGRRYGIYLLTLGYLVLFLAGIGKHLYTKSLDCIYRVFHTRDAFSWNGI